MNAVNQKTIITLGNGQLGLMLGKAAKSLPISYHMFSLEEAYAWLNEGDTTNCVVTFEQEHIDPLLLEKIQLAGIPSFPSWANFSLLRSKREQKTFLTKHHIPTASYITADKWDETILNFLQSKNGGVLKAGRGGYDGNGVWIVNEKGNSKDSSVEKILPQLKEAYLEEKISYNFELAAVVCRSQTGDIALYPTVKSIQVNGICTEVEYTEEFSHTPLAQEAGKIAQKIAEKLEYVGVLAVELFVVDGKLLVNEIAPRVHNSGHFTIDICAGSQFENHLRAGAGLPLSSSKPAHKAAIMVNLLWPQAETEFAPLYTRLSCGPDWPENVKLHWYGKSEIRPNRKMGHFTVYGSTIKECREIAQQILASRWA